MKFTDGYWMHRPGVEALFARGAHEIEVEDDRVVVLAPTREIERRGDTLNRPALTVTLTAPAPGVVGVRVEHHRGGPAHVGFDLVGTEPGHGRATRTADGATLVSGDLTAHVRQGAPWSLTFSSGDRLLTGSGARSLGHLRLRPDAVVEPDPVGVPAQPGGRTYLHEQLTLDVGEVVYGLGERFGPLVKNGQGIDVWNADGGTSSEQAYKNVPFYLTSRGYGVLVDHPGHVSLEVGSEAVERVQFSVPGEVLQYYVIAGGTPAEVLTRYTSLTGRPARVPAWSYGLWLSTSFTTDYDEGTVTRFLDGMAERDLPVSVMHFDTFWMREFRWMDFTWDSRTFPDPEGMLHRLHERGLRVCVWINPYIAQRSPAFDEARERGYLVRRPDGSVWQWDLWQAGMGLVDFTNPDATRWYQDKLRGLLAQGVDCFKTDFGERVPLDVVWHDGADPDRMHNWYTQLYNEAVFDVLEAERGEGEAVLFARSATVGGQRLPVHWGGDCTSSFVSMAESLRGGLSLAMSGFGFWSHDIGGFEGTPDPDVFKRWIAFGLLSSHSRLHGSRSYRVPWAVDEAAGTPEADPGSAVSVTRRFTRLKMELMPYLYATGLEAAATGIPTMRPMPLAFADDPATAYLDRQYMLGPDLLVAPVLSADGQVDLYLPAGGWTPLLGGERVIGGSWRRERHDVDSLPLYVRDGALLARSTRTDRPDHDHLDGLLLELYPGDGAGERSVEVTSPTGGTAVFRARWQQGRAVIESDQPRGWSVRTPGGTAVGADDGTVELTW